MVTELTQKIVDKCFSKADIIRELDLPKNGTSYRYLNKILVNFKTDHFDPFRKNRKYKLIEKKCPVCSSIFETSKGSNKEKTTCSRACSNTYFRSGPNNPNWSEDNYRTTCFFFHKKECIICGENKIVTVHHLDEDNTNNDPSNLIPLCPTHHQYWHSRFKSEIEERVYEYISSWEKDFKSE